MSTHSIQHRLVIGGWNQLASGAMTEATRFFQQGLGHRFPGVPLDIVRGAHTYIVEARDETRASARAPRG